MLNIAFEIKRLKAAKALLIERSLSKVLLRTFGESNKAYTPFPALI